MKQVIRMIGEYVEVTKPLAIQVVADEVADWVTATEDLEIGLDYIDKGDRYFIHEGELYTEQDDPETLLELAGYKVMWIDDLDDHDDYDKPYYDKTQMQWMM